MNNLNRANQKAQARKPTKHEIEKKIVRESEKEKVLEHIVKGPKPRTLGQKAADWMTKWVGSWTFIFLLSIYMAVWIIANTIGFLYQWDPWPFIILNLTLSCLAAVQAPIILMSQNREAERDRLKAEYDHRINKKSELEIEDMQKDLEIIKQMIREIKKTI